MSHLEIMLKSMERHLGPKPPISGFSHSLSPIALFAVGNIIAHWGMFDSNMRIWTEVMRHSEDMPERLAKEKVRPEFIHRASYHRRLATQFYKAGRPNAVKYYHKNIDRALQFKVTRDKLAHGTFSERDNKNFDGVVCHYKSRTHRLGLKFLIKTGQGLSFCSGFLMDFTSWNQALQQKALLEKLHEQGQL